jgi:hypothetical protein
MMQPSAVPFFAHIFLYGPGFAQPPGVPLRVLARIEDQPSGLGGARARAKPTPQACDLTEAAVGEAFRPVQLTSIVAPKACGGI